MAEGTLTVKNNVNMNIKLFKNILLYNLYNYFVVIFILVNLFKWLK
jgi:hypothetical protein